jgi:transposase-like protein
MKSYTPEERTRAIELYSEGWGYRKIASAFGCAESTVKKWVERAGLEKNPKPDHDVRTRNAAVSYYKRHPEASIAATARKYKVHPKTMARWLDRSNVEIRPAPMKFSRKEILADIESGMSGAAIARKHGCSESYVSALRNGRQ